MSLLPMISRFSAYQMIIRVAGRILSLPEELEITQRCQKKQSKQNSYDCRNVRNSFKTSLHRFFIGIDLRWKKIEGEVAYIKEMRMNPTLLHNFKRFDVYTSISSCSNNASEDLWMLYS